MRIKYGLDSRPGSLAMLMYGLQWLAVSVPGIVILGSVVSQIHSPDGTERIFYLQKLFALTGVALIAQMLWGHRLPLVIGPASVLLVGVVASQPASPAAVYTAIGLCGALLAVLAYSGALSKIQSVFTPRIVIVILCLVAFTLSPVILRMIFGQGGGHSLFRLTFALMLVISMLIANRTLNGIWKSTVVLLGLVIGSIAYGCFEGFPEVMAPVGQGGRRGLIPPEFDPGVILAFMFCFIALLVNELGSIQAVGGMLRANDMGRRTGRGVGIVGLGNLFSGAFGVVGPVDFSMSPGIISATGCASRYPLIVAGGLLAGCSLFPGAIRQLAAIPEAVMGSLLLYMMAAQLSAALQMLVREKAAGDFNSGIVIGLPLMIGLLLSFAPQEAIDSIPPLLRPVLGNGFVAGAIAVLLLEHLILRGKRKKKSVQDN